MEPEDESEDMLRIKCMLLGLEAIGFEHLGSHRWYICRTDKPGHLAFREHVDSSQVINSFSSERRALEVGLRMYLEGAPRVTD